MDSQSPLFLEIWPAGKSNHCLWRKSSPRRSNWKRRKQRFVVLLSTVNLLLFQPKFLSRAEREKLAIQKREAEVARQQEERKKLEEARKKFDEEAEKCKKFVHSIPPSFDVLASKSDRDKRDRRDRDRDRRRRSRSRSPRRRNRDKDDKKGTKKEKNDDDLIIDPRKQQEAIKSRYLGRHALLESK